MIPYTHWAYFPDEDSARRCAAELPDFVTRVRRAVEGGGWLLLAGRDVEIEDLERRHQQVAAVVVRHGGAYDGGECTYLDGAPTADPLLIGESDE